jgi:hypothetical protein
VTSTSFTQVLQPITTSHRHHFPDDVINNRITSPPITQVLSPITTGGNTWEIGSNMMG